MSGSPWVIRTRLDDWAVGLTRSSEEIDALTMYGDRIVVSTKGNYTVPKTGGGNLSGGDEDLIVLNPDNTWEQYFDGSDVSLTSSNEDVWGAWIGTDTDDVFLTTKNNYSVPGFPVNPLSGDQEEIILFAGTVGPSTSGTFDLFWNGDDNRFGGERLDGFSIEFLFQADADLSVTTQGNETGPVDAVFTVTLSEINTTGFPITFDIDDDLSGTATSGSD